MTNLYYLSQADGVGEWRMKEAKDLSDLVQNRITYLQVPTDTPAALPTGHLLSLSFMHTQIEWNTHPQRCSKHFCGCFHHAWKSAYAFLTISFTLACLICTIRNCQNQFLQGAGEECGSRLFQQLDLSGRILLLVTSLVTHKQSAIDEHADLQNDRPTRMQQCKKHLLGIRKDRNRTVLKLR